MRYPSCALKALRLGVFRHHRSVKANHGENYGGLAQGRPTDQCFVKRLKSSLALWRFLNWRTSEQTLQLLLPDSSKSPIPRDILPWVAQGRAAQGSATGVRAAISAARIVLYGLVQHIPER